MIEHRESIKRGTVSHEDYLSVDKCQIVQNKQNSTWFHLINQYVAEMIKGLAFLKRVHIPHHLNFKLKLKNVEKHFF